MKIDFEGISQRIIALPIPGAQLSGLVGRQGRRTVPAGSARRSSTETVRRRSPFRNSI